MIIWVLNKKNIEAYVPFKDMNTAYNDIPYHSSHFKYQSGTDSYICPNNEELKFRRIRENKQRNLKYRSQIFGGFGIFKLLGV